MNEGSPLSPLAMAHLLDPDRSSTSLSRCPPPMPAGVAFRPRTPADIPDLFDLFNEQTFLDNASTHGRFTSHDEFDNWLNGIAPCGKYEMVAQDGPRIVAFGGLYAFGDQMSHCGSLILGVSRDWQRKNIGSAMLYSLLAVAEIMMGLRKIVITVFEHNTGALCLYKNFGFEIEGRHRRFCRHGAEFIDAYSMALFFDPPAVRPPAVKI